MKSSRLALVVATVLVLACVTAIHQHRMLSGLKVETRSLEESLKKRRSVIQNRSLSSGALSAGGETSATMLKEAEEAFGALCRAEYYTPELEERLFLATSPLGASCLADLIQKLNEHEELAPGQEVSCVVMLFEDQPEKAVRIIQLMPWLAEYLPGAFRHWLVNDPAAAVRWFDEERGKGDPLTSDPKLQRAAAQALFRIDPDRGLALMLSTQPADLNEKEIGYLATASVEVLIDEREHAAYLAALRRAFEKSPGNPLLEKIQAAYLKELPERLRNWIFEDASALLDAELSRDQQITIARDLAVFTPEEPEKWMNWFTRIGGKFDREHPARVFLSSWLHLDYPAVGRWLDQYPPGTTKNEFVCSYARQILKAAPEDASRRAATLPEGPQREDLFKAIHASWQAKDPEAAARFARENGLAE